MRSNHSNTLNPKGLNDKITVIVGEENAYDKEVQEAIYMYGLKDSLIREIASIAEKCGLSSVTLFGSRARGDYHTRSDIDLVVSGGDYDRFVLDVDEETSTLLMFDVVNMDGVVQPELLTSIRREGKLLYAKV